MGPNKPERKFFDVVDDIDELLRDANNSEENPMHVRGLEDQSVPEELTNEVETTVRRAADLKNEIDADEEAIKEKKRRLEDMKANILETWTATGITKQTVATDAGPRTAYVKNVETATVRKCDSARAIEWLKETCPALVRTVEKFSDKDLREYCLELDAVQHKLPDFVSIYRGKQLVIRRS